MKYVCVLALCVLAGCATRPSLEELEREALATGDWSEVEKLEAVLAKRELESARKCPEGMTNVCSGSLFIERCKCRPSDGARQR